MSQRTVKYQRLEMIRDVFRKTAILQFDLFSVQYVFELVENTSTIHWGNSIRQQFSSRPIIVTLFFVLLRHKRRQIKVGDINAAVVVCRPRLN